MSAIDKSKLLVVITGASSGIGFQTALDAARAGYPVLAIARRKELLEDLVAKAPQGRILISAVDVTNFDAMKQAIEEAEKSFDAHVDLMVNNAGLMALDLFADQPVERYETMVQVNIMGVLHGCKVVIDGMVKRQRGTIINISSIAGRKGFPNHAAYCATKFAVHGFTETLREEVARHGVRVMIVAPGVVDTALLSASNEGPIREGYESWKKQMGKALQSEDISRIILFAYEMPPHVTMREILVGPTTQQP